MSSASMFAIASSLFLTIVLTACSRPAESTSITIEHQIAPQPVRVGPATLQLRLADASSQPVKGAVITLEGNMTHAGMNPVFAQAKETGPGHYQSSLNLTMAGDWTILVHITLADGRRLERQLDVKGVRSD